MKRNIFTLSFCLLCALSVTYRASADTFSTVKITQAENSLTAHSAAIGSLLPADFTSSVFDSEGNPTMDRLFLFMTLPAGMSDYTITEPMPRIVMTTKGESLNDGFDMDVELPSVILQAGQDVVFSFVKSGSAYVLDRMPFDPTTRAMEPITIADATTEKVYITGRTTSELSAELPEGIAIYAPSYLNSIKQSFSDLFVQYIHSAIAGGLDDFSFNPNCEGFFTFTGGQGSKVELYTDNFSIQVADKKTDFIGSVLASIANIDLMPIEGPTLKYSESFYDTETEEWMSKGDLMPYKTYSNEELQEMDADKVQAFSEQQIRSFSAEQIKIIATRMSANQCTWLTTGQVLDLCGISDILLAMDPDAQEAIGTTLGSIFQDQTKVQNAAGALDTNRILGAIAMQLQPLLNGGSNPLDLLGALTGGAELNLIDMIGKIFGSMVEGTASPFAFKSNSDRTNTDAFEVKIHNKGTTTITGGAIGEFKNVGVEMGALAAQMGGSSSTLGAMVNDLAIMFQAMVRFTSAPLAVRPSAKIVQSEDDDQYRYTCTRFIFDDIWTDGTTHTNGLLCLPVEGDELDAPSIDIGNPNGQVVFNSGRYKFHTPVSNKKKNMFYVATMAICYREFAVNMPLAGNITYTGIGTSVGWGPSQNRTDSYRNVIINDGTFSTYSAEAWKDPSRGENAIDAVGNGWYQHYTDLRLPYNTSILGGTFPDNTYVYRCDAAAEQGVAPVYIYQANDNSPQYFTSLCERKLVPAAALSEAYTQGQTTPVVVDADKVESELKFTVNGTSTKWTYGHNSMVADNSGNIYLYVPGNCYVDYTYVRNYVTALAPFGEKHMGTEMLKMGGDQTVESLYRNNENFPLKNAYLLYTQLGYYTYNYAGVNLGGLNRTLQEEFQIDRELHHNFKNTSTTTNASGQNIMTTTDKTGVVFSEITNDDEYTIEHGVYMMLPVMSDQWMIFCPPFDVANVYILETTDEQPKAEKTAKNTSGWTDAQFDEFFQRQGAADGDMAQTLVTSVLPDIFSGKGSGVKQPLPYILNNLTNDKTTLSRLTHYDGTMASLYTANYYLNVQKPDVADKSLWKQEEDENKYGDKWEVAPAQSAPTFVTRRVINEDCDFYDDDCQSDIEVQMPYVDQDGNEQAQQWCIMQRGKVYSMYFPGGANRWYDHKYLIVEGYGPQKLSGKDAHADFYTPVPSSPGFPTEEGYIALQGNSTFGNASIAASSTYPLFYARKTSAGDFNTSLTGDKPHYSFEPNTASSQRVLPASVYMVSPSGSATKTSMPELHNTNRDLTEEGRVPLLVEQASLNVWTDDGIFMQAGVPRKITVFYADGRVLWQGELEPAQTRFVPAGKGIYIVRGEETAVKVMVQ